MHARAHRVTQGCIDHLMAFDQPFALELVTYHQRLEMVATTGRVLNLDVGAGQTVFDQLLYLRRIHRAPILAILEDLIPPPAANDRIPA